MGTLPYTEATLLEVQRLGATGMNVKQWNLYNTLRPRQNGRHFADGILNSIFLNENVWISIKISLKFVPKGSINNIPSLVQIMAWRRPDAKPLSEAMMVNLPTHICVTRPQWDKATTELCCLPRQAVFHAKQNKHDSVKTAPGKWRNLCVLGRVSGSYYTGSTAISWHGSKFRIAGPLWGVSTGPRWTPPPPPPLHKWTSNGVIHVFFVVNPNKLLNKRSSWCWC